MYQKECVLTFLDTFPRFRAENATRNEDSRILFAFRGGNVSGTAYDRILVAFPGEPGEKCIKKCNSDIL